jgi:integrative and conjugative element protein (TIGR02256 family)
MRSDADRWYDKETGGSFMGYWSADRTAVVTAMIPCGPNATHERDRFRPDQDWQQDEIAKHYQRSGRLDTYLGDWHTHPDATYGQLSGADRACLKTIIRTSAARASKPVMMVMCGRPDDWILFCWVGELKRRLIWIDGLVENEADIELYSPQGSSTHQEPAS